MIFKRKKDFGTSSYDYMIVGLGNPGAKYEMTRHNAGFLAIDLLVRHLDVDIKKLKFHALITDAKIGGCRCLLMKPQTFMNNSGEAVGEAARFYKIPPEKIIILSDDVTLDVGKIRVRRKGSAGGHNGLKSIIAHLGTQEFPRVKIGVGKKPDALMDLVDWVLGTFPKEQHSDLKTALENAVGAVADIIENGVDSAMNKYN